MRGRRGALLLVAAAALHVLVPRTLLPDCVALASALLALLVLPPLTVRWWRREPAELTTLFLGPLVALIGACALLAAAVAAGIPVRHFAVILSIGSVAAAALALTRAPRPWHALERGEARLVVACVAGALVCAIPFLSTRVVASWHGFFHAAVAQSIVAGHFPPLHPGLAGEPLNYQWGFHLAPALLGEMAATDPLRALLALNVAWIVVAALAIVAAARPFCPSASVRALAPLALFGAINTLAPLVLLFKRLRFGELPGNEFSAGEWIDWLAQRAIPGNDQNVQRAWWDVRATSFLKEFLDASAMATGLTFGIALLAVAVRSAAAGAGTGLARERRALPLLMVATAVAYPPLLPVQLAVAGLFILVLLLPRSGEARAPRRGLFAFVLALIVALAAALPYLRAITDMTRFTAAAAEPFARFEWRGARFWSLAAFGALAPLLLPGVLELWRRRDPPARLLLALFVPLLILVVGVRMQQGTEYKFLYAAAPSVALVALVGLERLVARRHDAARRRLLLLAALVLAGAPVLFAAGALASSHFAESPFKFAGRAIGRREPGDREACLAFVRDQGAADAVLIAPLVSSRKSPNNDNFVWAALADRPLYVAEDSQLCGRMADFARRKRIAAAVLEGRDVLTTAAELRAEGRRFVAVVHASIAEKLLAEPRAGWTLGSTHGSQSVVILDRGTP